MPYYIEAIEQETKLREKQRPGPARLPADQRTKARSIRLNDSRWKLLKALGREWLERMIDKAKETT